MSRSIQSGKYLVTGAFGGVGLRGGRRDPDSLRVGERLLHFTY